MEETGDSKLVPRDEEEIVNDNEKLKRLVMKKKEKMSLTPLRKTKILMKTKMRQEKCKKASLSTMMMKMKTQEQVFPKKEENIKEEKEKKMIDYPKMIWIC